MITEKKISQTVMGGVTEAKSFSIEVNAKAFELLSSGLYTDKPLAIVRELSCNAFDAHMEAGNADRPFLIQLPNDLEPEFRIRDYGTGLKHEQVMKLYSSYFTSTKTNTNNQIGAFGLGSKSPFSYTDTFTVTSYGKTAAIRISRQALRRQNRVP